MKHNVFSFLLLFNIFVLFLLVIWMNHQEILTFHRMILYGAHWANSLGKKTHKSKMTGYYCMKRFFIKCYWSSSFLYIIDVKQRLNDLMADQNIQLREILIETIISAREKRICIYIIWIILSFIIVHYFLTWLYASSSTIRSKLFATENSSLTLISADYLIINLYLASCFILTDISNRQVSLESILCFKSYLF